MPTLEHLQQAYDRVANSLLDDAAATGTWVGELSSSPLSTATAVVALMLVGRERQELRTDFKPLILGGLKWLSEHQNEDGGWGDTVLSKSNISTSTLCFSAFRLSHAERDAGRLQREAEPSPDVLQDAAKVIEKADTYMRQNGGFDAIRRRYGKDKTFSVPILTQCALAGLISWRQLSPLPFELGVFPHSFFRWVTLPVVSYALPALIAIGQVRHHHAPSWNPIVRLIRNLAVGPTLKKLTSIQPESGGFLEATPLTSFVTMSLASMGRSDHPVVRLGVKFLVDSVRPDGSWTIDTNLATWVTTLSVNAFRPDSLSVERSAAIASWLLDQQHREVHRYTEAAPGGWAWTNLSGGVPDADDTPGAILALLKLKPNHPRLADALTTAVDWLLGLQNRDGGWPTFCRGWGSLPFDRSAPDLTAHVLRAFRAWLDSSFSMSLESRRSKRVEQAMADGFRFLERTQRADGTWLPLWFGNQFAVDEENPVYGTARVLIAYRDCGRRKDPAAQRASAWLASIQNSDGGWGGTKNTPSTVEETSLAAEALLGDATIPKPFAGMVSMMFDLNSEKSPRKTSARRKSYRIRLKLLAVWTGWSSELNRGNSGSRHPSVCTLPSCGILKGFIQ